MGLKVKFGFVVVDRGYIEVVSHEKSHGGSNSEAPRPLITMSRPRMT